jgi:hypothetical protein
VVVAEPGVYQFGLPICVRISSIRFPARRRLSTGRRSAWTRRASRPSARGAWATRPR